MNVKASGEPSLLQFADQALDLAVLDLDQLLHLLNLQLQNLHRDGLTSTVLLSYLMALSFSERTSFSSWFLAIL